MAGNTSTTNFTELSQGLFSFTDFVIFALMLGISALIGVYYGFCGSKQNTAHEYLLGGKKMQVFPVAMSLIASHTSGIALLAVPADVYLHGATYGWICVAIIITCVVSFFVFLPVFLKLHLTSTYEYLKIRFNNKLRVFASFLFTLHMLLYNPIVIYVPALAFTQATGTSLYVITPIVCLICVFYTTIGGLKAVVWTDTIQGLAIAASMSAVFFLGISSVGGMSAIWQKSIDGHRLDVFEFSTDITKRDTFWALTLGASASWICNFGVNQGTVQRFLAVPSPKQAKTVVLIFCLGVVFVKITSTYTGLIIYTKYADCDPLLTKTINRNDQLLPYYVMDVAGSIPGLPGLFIAGVFSAGLSTLSTTLNTLSATIYEDFLSPLMPHDISQKKVSNILKLIVIITGAISTALVFVVEKLGGILPLVVSLGGITSGPLLGLFSLGMLFPSANSKGALCGGIASLLFNCWMAMGQQYYKKMGYIKEPTKPQTIDGCNFPVNVTQKYSLPIEDEPFILYRISFWYYSLLGTFVVIIVGLVVSWLTKKDEPPVHPDLISPVVRFLLPKGKESISELSPVNYYNIDKALTIVTANSEKENNAS